MTDVLHLEIRQLRARLAGLTHENALLRARAEAAEAARADAIAVDAGGLTAAPLTFADLAVGEWFVWAVGDERHRRKGSLDAWFVGNALFPHHLGDHGYAASKPVIRVSP